VRPITARRLANFRAHRRGYWSLWIFAALFVFTLFAEFIANDRPLVVWYDGALYTPVLNDYPERTFGGDLPGTTDYSDKFIQEQIAKKGWMLWPLGPYNHKTSVRNLTRPAPRRPRGRTGSAPTIRRATCWRA
jgi:microcin C transport system permease protein